MESDYMPLPLAGPQKHSMVSSLVTRTALLVCVLHMHMQVGLPLRALRSLICLGLPSEEVLQSQTFRLQLVTSCVLIDWMAL